MRMRTLDVAEESERQLQVQVEGGGRQRQGRQETRRAPPGYLDFGLRKAPGSTGAHSGHEAVGD